MAAPSILRKGGVPSSNSFLNVLTRERIVTGTPDPASVWRMAVLLLSPLVPLLEKEKRSLGAKETGAHAALPIWMNFMNAAMAGKDPGQFQEAPYVPVTVVQKVDTPDTTPGADETH